LHRKPVRFGVLAGFVAAVLFGCERPRAQDAPGAESEPPERTESSENGPESSPRATSSEDDPGAESDRSDQKEQYEDDPAHSPSEQSASRGSSTASGGSESTSSYPAIETPLLRKLSSKRRGILGRQAPAFQIDTWIGPDGSELGDPVRLKDLRGKFVFLLFWQSWCPGCHERGFPTLRTVSEHFADSDRIAFFAVQTVFEGFSINTADKIREVREKFDLRMPMAHDDGSRHDRERSYLMDRYRTGGTPWIVIIDPSGRVVFNNFHISSDRAIEYLEAHAG